MLVEDWPSEESVGDDGSGSDASICSEEMDEEDDHIWKRIFEKDVDDIHIIDNGVDQYMLGCIDRELEGVVANIKEALGLELDSTPSMSDIFCFWLGDFCLKLRDHVNANGAPKFTDIDIVKFVHFEIAAAMYKTSPKRLFAFDKHYQSASSIMSHGEYLAILRRLSRPKYKQDDYTFDRGIDEIEKFMSSKCRTCYIPQETIVALDDDKLSGNVRTLKKMELVCKKIKKNWGPINHAVVSVMTGIYLGGLLEKRGRSVAETVQYLCDDLADSRRAHETVVKNLITKDRGYNTKVVSDLCLRLQARELGSRRKETNFPFTFGRTPTESQELVEETNHFVARWATVKVNMENRADTITLSGIAWRCDGRVALLQTSEKCMGAFHWTYDTSGVLPSPIVQISSNCNHLETTAADHIREVRSNILEITQQQRTPEWFLLRRFRITSSVCGRIMAKWFKFGLDKYIDTIQNDRDIISESKDMVCDIIGFNQARPVTSAESRKRELLDKKKRTELVDICNQHKDLMRSRNLTVGSKKKAEIIDMILECPEIDIDVHDCESVSFDQILHDAWFMSPCASRSMDIGSSNEEVVLNRLKPFLVSHSPYTMQAITFLGLFADRQHHWVATSVDGLAVLAPKETEPFSATANGFPVFVEIKTRSANKTVDEISRIDTLNGARSFYDVNIVEEPSRFHQLIPNRDYRAQVIHHAVTGKLNRVLYIESTTRRIVYAVLVHIPDEVHTSIYISFLNPLYYQFIAPLCQKLDKPYNNSTQILRDMNLSPGYAGDELTYRQAYLIAAKLFARVIRNGKALEPASKIRPFAVGAWNRLKGGVDVYSRLISNTHGCLHNTLPFIGKYMLRNLFTLLMNSHLTIRIFTVKRELDDLPVSTRFSTFTAYKRRLNSIKTFDDFLSTALDIYIPELYKWMERKKRRPNIDPGAKNLNLKPIVRATKRRRNSSSRHQRQIWDAGSLSAFRKLGKSVSHVLANTSTRNERDNDGAVRKQKIRCIVCCELCATNKHGASRSSKGRKGCRTSVGCRDCAVEAQRDSSFQTELLALCTLKRFSAFPDDEFQRYRDLTCWEIHHSSLPYPTLRCCTDNLPRTHVDVQDPQP